MAFGFGFGMPRSFALPQFSPLSLFANGEQGWWYDPSNYGPNGTLYQDSAGTTPVTAVEQPVGLQLDLSGRGNHRFQTTSANRPVVSARVNLLTKTEQFDDAVWTKTNVTAANTTATTDPLGGNTADLISLTGATATKFILQGASVIVPRVASIYLKAGTHNFVQLMFDGASAQANFNISTGEAGVVSGGTSTITSVGNGWFLAQFTSSAGGSLRIYAVDSNSAAWASTTSSTGNFFIWGADLRPTNQGVGLPAYQRVNTSTDYDSTGFPVYIKPNGSNQFMQTNSINFTATDKMTVWQGVRKLGTTSSFITSIISGSFTQGFEIGASTTVASDYRFASAGSVYVAVEPTGYTTPVTNVLTGIGDISGDVATLRVNGAQVATSSSNQGTGNYGNFPAYFYQRGASNLYFNGNDYGSIARGAASTAAQITTGETYINSKTKAY